MPKDKFRLMRLGALPLVLFIELMAVSLNFDAYSPAMAEQAPWFSFLAYAGQFAKFLVVAVAAFTLAVWVRLPKHFEALQSALVGHRYYWFATAQLVAFMLFYWNTAAVFGSASDKSMLPTGIVAGWFSLLISVGALWLLSVAPWHYWKQFVALEKKAILFSLTLGLLAWWLAQLSQELWTPLSALTFDTSAFLLSLIYSEIVIDPAIKNLGTTHFVVSIAPACSGYEGIGLVTIFTAFYLSLFRKEFRFPHSLLLFPIGIATIWVFNAVRIVILIAIGSSFSPEVALGGFHSQAGWISFIIVIFGLLIIAHKVSFFSTKPTTPLSSSSPISLPMAILIPFMVLLAATILTSAFSADFDWLYPFRVVATAMALRFCWKYFSLTQFKIHFEPVLAGVLVFVLWILLIPNDLEKNQLFAQNLFDTSQSVSITWLVFRFLGAVVTVPIIEELLFRGYLLCRVAKAEVRLEGRLALSWLALLVSSVLFGLLHSTLVAGTLAGLVYGLVRYRGNSVWDAVIAHAVTNLLLSVLVLWTGDWSLW
jgi:exosortase E/protease (VPEID-CTERM system)